MDKIKKLAKLEQKIRQERVALEEEKRQKVYIPQLIKYIGRYFVYRNNTYGSDTKPWDEFYKVIDFIDNSFIVENFSVDCYGKAVIQIESKFIYIDGRKPFDGDSEEEITKEEYERERIKVCQELLGQESMRKYLERTK